jgi:transcriptional regulator CtsR
MRLKMTNSLITTIQNSLATKFDSQSLQKRLDRKVLKQLDYELMFKTLESVVEETVLEYQGSESCEFLKQKYFEKFSHLLQLMSGVKVDEQQDT